MFAKQWSSGLHGGVWLILLLFFPALISAGSLVTRDDFICYDTTANFVSNTYDDVAIDDSGRISQTGCRWVSGGPFTWDLFYEFNRFDRFGNQSQPVTIFLPDTIGQDSVWLPESRLECYSNNLGVTFIPGTARFDTTNFPVRAFTYLFGVDGQSLQEPRCFDCDVPYDSSDLRGQFYYGGINNSGVVGAVWSAGMLVPPGHESLFVRLYYPEVDSLSEVLQPTALPLPLPHECVYRNPHLGIADDGSFVVAWVDVPYYRTFYVIYNADLTQRTPVMIADCIGDTSNCAPHAMQMDLAMEADGDFYIAWYGPYIGESDSYTYSQMWVRGFNADGSPKYDPLLVNDVDSLYVSGGEEITPSVACDDSGNVLVVLSDARDYPGVNPYGETYRNVYAQKIDPEGQLIGPNYRVNNFLGHSGWFGRNIACEMNNLGQAVILWRCVNTDYRVWAQLMPYHDIGTFIPGDINLDFSCNVNDLVYFVDHLFFDTTYPFWPRDLIDLNGDGANGNVVDLVYVVDYLFFGGPEPVTPYEGVRQPPPHYSSASGDAAQDPQDLAPRMDVDQLHRADSAWAWPFGK